MRCAWATRSPVRPSVTMRRAISPAIWRTSTGPAGPRIPTEACSLSRLAFSDAACRNFPGLRCTSSIDPASGYRFTCTSKTFMKIEMRVASVLRYIGSCTTATSTILPSAGAMMNRSPRGPRRSGSRKNTSSHTASANRIASGIQSHAIPRPAPHAPTPASVHPGRMKGQPSGAILTAHASPGNGVPVSNRYASKYRALVACTTWSGSRGGGALPSHSPCCLSRAR